MKKLLLIGLLFSANYINAQKINASKIIGKPIKVENLLVAQHDFPNRSDWYLAQRFCADLGSGWRLPTKEELVILYRYKKEIGGFADKLYWSSSPYMNTSAWFLNFTDCDPGAFNMYKELFVRAVKSL
jgi:hypothetical protein